MPYPCGMQYALQQRVLCLVSHSILILTLHSLNYKWCIFCYPTSRVHGRCLENTNFFIVLFYRSLPMDAYFVLDYSLYECSISHECYPLRLYHIPRIVSLTIASFHMNSFLSRAFVWMRSIANVHTFTNAFFSFPFVMRSILQKCSLAKCVLLSENVPLRMGYPMIHDVTRQSIQHFRIPGGVPPFMRLICIKVCAFLCFVRAASQCICNCIYCSMPLCGWLMRFFLPVIPAYDLSVPCHYSCGVSHLFLTCLSSHSYASLAYPFTYVLASVLLSCYACMCVLLSSSVRAFASLLRLYAWFA